MWRPFRRGANPSAYTHNTRYNPQPTEDRDAALQKGQAQPLRRPNYKPTALRWYFIVCQIVLLSAMIFLVAYARLRMPGSDSTAVIEGRSEGVRGHIQPGAYAADGSRSHNRRGTGTDGEDPARRDDGPHPEPAPRLLPRLDEPLSTPFLAPRETPSDPTTTLAPSDLQSLHDQSASLSPQAAQEKNGKEIDVTVPRIPCGTSTLCTSSITTSVIITVVVPERTATLTITSGMSTRTTVVPVTTTTVIPGKAITSSQLTTIEITTEVPMTSVFTLFPTGGPNGTAHAPQPTTQTYMSESVVTKSMTIPIVAHEPPQTKTITASETVSEVVPAVTTSLSVAPAETYFSLGPTVIEVTYTPAARRAGERAPVTHIITTVEPGRTVTEVVRQAPVELLVGGGDRVETRRVEQGAQEVVTRLGGSVTNVVVVITPSPLTGDGDGGEGDSPGDVGPDDDGEGGFRPVSLTVVSEVGGVLQTFTVQDAPRTAVITHADGAVETAVTTPPPRITTSRVDGSLTTFELATTPTGTELLSFTVVSTIDGTLTTIKTTPSASEIVTTIDGTISTITSTPSSTRTSTIPGTTKTIESVSTPTPTAPEPELNEYNVDATDYFVGKFLPALLATILAIPLRIIDLNAKLYQPFYALNAENGALGSESMTLHFTGLNALTKPFYLLFEGRPMTAITSAILLCSSFSVPLAAEAFGLKIHGRCTAESIKGCALDLGVSPAPAHALLAVLALTVTLLLLLLLLTRNMETGLYANPWSIAGIASLTRSADVRVHSSKEADIRRAMANRRYGFGFFRNTEGRDEYGIVLRDDSGRNLREGEAGSESEDDLVYSVDDENGRAKRRAAGRRMPLLALGYPWRVAFILFLVGLFVVILYYHVSVLQGSSSRFKRFMNSHNFGARFFFAGVGVVVTFAWLAFFVSKSTSSQPFPFHLFQTHSFHLSSTPS